MRTQIYPAQIAASDSRFKNQAEQVAYLQGRLDVIDESGDMDITIELNGTGDVIRELIEDLSGNLIRQMDITYLSNGDVDTITYTRPTEVYKRTFIYQAGVLKTIQQRKVTT